MDFIATQSVHQPLTGEQAWQTPGLRCLGSVQGLTGGGTNLATEAEWCQTPDKPCYPYYNRA